jgi:hypothetical protein
VAVYEPIIPNIPPWVYDRVCTQGLTTAAQVLRGLVASADENGDTAAADAFQMWTDIIESSAHFPGAASGRATIMHIVKK